MLGKRLIGDLLCKLSTFGKNYGIAYTGGEQMKKKAQVQRRSLFQHQTSEFFQRSTLHGVSDWYRADTTLVKGFWVVVILGALSAAVYGCYAILEQYMKAPVVVSYFVQQPTRVDRGDAMGANSTSLKIPDVIVCPFNRFDQRFLKANNISADLAMFMEFAFGLGAKHPAQRSALFSAYQSALKNWTTLNSQLNQTLTNMNMTFERFLDASSVPCAELLIHCVGANGPFNCCGTGASLMSGSGLCYRVEGSEQKGSGYPFAMTVVINIPKERYHLVPNNMLNDGVAIKLAEAKQGMDFDLTFLPAGTHAIMPLKATSYEFMNDPPRYECVAAEDGNYSHITCLDSCPWEHAQNKCGCSHPAASYPSKLLSCTTDQVINCLMKQFPNLTFVDALLASCRQKCKPRCKYWQYGAAVSYTKFPTEKARQFMSTDEEWERVKNSIILDVYFERFEYTVIKHYSAMTVHSFIANIGGQYSLWLGGSILTLIQIMVFIIQYILNRCCTKVKRRGMTVSRADSSCVNTNGNNNSNRNRVRRRDVQQAPPTENCCDNAYDSILAPSSDNTVASSNGCLLQRSASLTGGGSFAGIYSNAISGPTTTILNGGPGMRKKSKHSKEFLF